MGLHAKLQPSSAKRWLECPGSVELCSNVIDSGSKYADEGTAGHAIFEAQISGAAMPKVVNIDGTRSWPVDDALVEAVKPAVEWAVEYKAEHSAAIFAERKYEIGVGFGLKPGLLWGTADFTALSRDELCIADLKLGYNDVPVAYYDEATGKKRPNEQLGQYGLGALDATGWMHDRIRLVILQPRTSDEPKEVVFTADEMEEFRQEWKPKVLTAAQGGPLVPSEEACRWCKAAGVCPALKAETMALARRDMANLITLSGEEVAELLDKGAMIENAMKAVRAHALRLLEFDERAVPGYKRVQGEKHRAWTAGAFTIEEKLTPFAVDPFEKCLRSPAQVEALLADKLKGATVNDELIKTKKKAKEVAKALVATLAAKPPGEPTLAHIDDTRPALGPAFTADDVKGLDEKVDEAEVID